MKMRRTALAAGLIMVLAVWAGAATRYAQITELRPILSLRGSSAQCTVKARATDSIELLVYLKDSDGMVLEEWNRSDAGGSISFSESCPGMKSGERYTLTATARSGGESVTETDTATCP